MNTTTKYIKVSTYEGKIGEVKKILLLYSGATYSTADVISTYIFRRGLINADYSYGAAVSIFQSVIALILIISANKIADKIGQNSLW